MSAIWLYLIFIYNYLVLANRWDCFIWQEWGSTFFNSECLGPFCDSTAGPAPAVWDQRLLIKHLWDLTLAKLVGNLRMQGSGWFVSLLLILAFYSLQFKCMLIQYLPLSIFITFLCFDGYFYTFAASVYDTVTTGVAFCTTIFHIRECFRRKSLLLMYKFIKICAFKNIYGFIKHISLMESLKHCF